MPETVSGVMDMQYSYTAGQNNGRVASSKDWISGKGEKGSDAFSVPETVSGVMDMQYSYTAGQNNGRIASSKDWISGEEVTYAYDSLQRLARAETTGPEWGAAYSYDGFGNLTAKTPTKGSAPALSMAYDPATNWPVNGNYDANGNAPIGIWDAENRLVTETLDGQTVQWGYDPNGKRVSRYQVVGGNPQWTFYYYNIQGQQIGQVTCKTRTDGFKCLTDNGSVYFGDKLIARVDASGNLTGVVTDRMGTVRGIQSGGEDPTGVFKCSPNLCPEQYAPGSRQAGWQGGWGWLMGMGGHAHYAPFIDTAQAGGDRDGGYPPMRMPRER